MNLRSPLLDSLTPTLHAARAALRDWSSPLINPFMAQARAQETQRPTLWRALGAIVLLWGAFLLIYLSVTRGGERDVAGDAARLWIGLALIVALCTRIARCSGLLRVEVLKNRFEPLQLLPLESARRAWLWCAPVSLFALTICALSLPALAWEIGSRRIGWGDALGLGFIALVLSWGAPLWRPHVWRAHIDKTGTGRASASDDFTAPPSPVAPAAINFWNSGVLIALAALLGGGAGFDALAIYWQSLPAHLRATGDDWLINWPLFGARWLTEFQPFFGFALPPLVLLAPVWTANVHNTILRLGAVTALEPYWTPPRALHWWRAGRIVNWGLLTFGFGVFWAGAIKRAWLADWFVGGARTSDEAVAVWWIVVLFVGVVSAAARAKQTLEAPTERTTLGAQSKRALRAAARALLWALLVFIGSCALGWAWPFGAIWCQMLPASLAIAATWLGAALTVSLSERIPRSSRALRGSGFVWFCGGPALYIALHYLKIDIEPFTPQIYFLSPWTLWWTLRDPNIAANALFWPAITTHFALFAARAILIWRARYIVIGAVEGESPADKSPATAATAPWNELRENEQSPNEPVPNDDEELDFDEDEEDDEPAPAATSVLGRASLPAPDAWLNRILDWQNRFDNPLLRLETRRVIGNGVAATLIQAQLLSGALALLLIVILPAWGFYNGAFPAEFAVGALALSLFVWCVVPLNGIEGTSRCYDHDRVDGSLQMLFLTPLTERQIAGGKIGPFLTRAALLLAFYSPLWLLGLAPALLYQEPIIVAVCVLAPLYAVSFALRIAAISHWTALKKRKIGGVSVPSIVVLGAIFSVPAELTALFAGADGGALPMTLILLGLSLILLAEAALFWWLSLRQLRHRRLLDAPVGR